MSHALSCLKILTAGQCRRLAPCETHHKLSLGRTSASPHPGRSLGQTQPRTLLLLTPPQRSNSSRGRNAPPPPKIPFPAEGHLFQPSLALNLDPDPGPLLAHLTPPPASSRAPIQSCSSYRSLQLTRITQPSTRPPHHSVTQPVRHPASDSSPPVSTTATGSNSPRAWPVLNSGAPTPRQQHHPTCISSSPVDTHLPCDSSPALYQIQTQGPTPSCIKNRPGFPLACS